MARQVKSSTEIIRELKSRREFLRFLSQASAAGLFAPSLIYGLRSAPALGSSTRNRFVIYIHAGSWDGWTSGLVQPNATQTINDQLRASWQRGIFYSGQQTDSLNPNVNLAYRHNNLIFNSYSKVLLPIADHMTFAVGSARSAGHSKAEAFQSTGGDESALFASWVAGAAQLINSSNSAFIVSSAPRISVQRSPATSKVSLVQGLDAPSFVRNLADAATVPTGQDALRFWEVARDLMTKKLIRADVDQTERSAYRAFTNQLVDGVAGFGVNDPMYQSIASVLNQTAVNNLINNEIGVGQDSGGIILGAYQQPALMEELRLAAMLAKSGMASGMSIRLPNEDHHFGYNDGNGGSTVGTPRRAAQTWSQIRLFWEWIIQQGMQDDVLIIMSHDFNRSNYNTTLGSNITFKGNGSDVTIKVPGTDHSVTMGMVFINGRVPASGRVGMTGDSNVAKATSDANGTIVSGTPFTSDQLVGSMLLRIFDDVIPNFDALKKIWPKMNAPISFLID